jgi:hypothetical protein
MLHKHCAQALVSLAIDNLKVSVKNKNMGIQKYLVKIICIALFISTPICVVPNECGSKDIEKEISALHCVGKKIRQTDSSIKLLDIFKNTAEKNTPQAVFATRISSHFSPPVSITDLTPAQLLL